MNKVKINDVEYNFAPTIRSMIAFEQALNKRFTLDTLTDIYTYMYCILLANNDGFDIDFEQFMTILDENPSLQLQMNNIIFGNAKEKDEVKKK